MRAWICSNGGDASEGDRGHSETASAGDPETSRGERKTVG